MDHRGVMTTSSPGRRDEGFGLIETMIAVLVLSLSLVALVPVLTESGSKATSQSSMEVTAAGVARNWLEFYQQQLDREVQDTTANGMPACNNTVTPTSPQLFTYPFSQCNTATSTWVGCATRSSPTGGIQATANSYVLCPGGSTYAAQKNGSDQNMTVQSCGPTNCTEDQYAYCTDITNPACAYVQPAISGAVLTSVPNANCTFATKVAVGGYCVWITGYWQCLPSQYNDNLDEMADFVVKVRVTWPNEPTYLLSAGQGTSSTSLSLVEAPPSIYANQQWWSDQETGYNECNPQF